jgi:hypothetical protein
MMGISVWRSKILGKKYGYSTRLFLSNGVSGLPTGLVRVNGSGERLSRVNDMFEAGRCRIPLRFRRTSKQSGNFETPMLDCPSIH